MSAVQRQATLPEAGAAEPEVLMRVVNRVAVITLNRPAGRLEGDGHAAGKHRVQEFTRIAEQRIALAPQRFDIGRIADRKSVV